MRSITPTLLAVALTTAVTSTFFYHIVETRSRSHEQFREQMMVDLGTVRTKLGTLSSKVDEVTRTSASRTDVAEVRATLAALRTLLDTPTPPDSGRDDRVTDRLEQSASASEAPGSYQNVDALRAVVQTLLEDEREARREATRATRWDRLRKWKSHREGPFGEYNVRVNTLTERLDLDDEQTSFYYELLEDYNEKAGALYEGVDFNAALTNGSGIFQERLEEIESEKKILDSEFDREFLGTLSPEQARGYEEFAPEDRGVGPNAGLSRMQIQIGDLGGELSDQLN